MKELLRQNPTFKEIFRDQILLWKRFIDDCGGMSLGDINDFLRWFGILKEHFRKYELDLTFETDSETKEVPFLDIEMFKEGDTIHTKEHRKETSALSFLHYSSAHPRYVFKGIMKSQIQRIRRLCSRDSDFTTALQSLRQRCEASGYRLDDIDYVFSSYENLARNLYGQPTTDRDDHHEVRLVALAGTPYAADIDLFAKRMNRVLSSSKIRVSVIRTTGPSIAKMLFHNNDSTVTQVDCRNCIVCNNQARNSESLIRSTTTGKTYQTARNISCRNGGIYIFEGDCVDQYTGKTTVEFGTRTLEHVQRQKSSSVYKHRNNCEQCRTTGKFNVTFVEDYRNRGKYTLSEREYLWNYRIKGVINGQKTLIN